LLLIYQIIDVVPIESTLSSLNLSLKLLLSICGDTKKQIIELFN